MRKDNVDFLSKFGERVEKIGKDGIIGIIKKHSGPSINHNNIIYNELFNRDFKKHLTFKSNSYIFEQNNTYLINNRFANNNSNILNNLNIYPNYPNNPRKVYLPINLFMESDKSRKSINSNNYYRSDKQPLLYSCQINKVKNPFENEDNNYYNSPNINKYKAGDNRQKILDYGYKPYTIKDYKKINNEIDRGKLDLNFVTKEWKEKKERMKKMSDYGKQIMIKEKKSNFKKNENEYGEKSDEIKNEDEKWNYINEYSEEKNYNINNKSNRKLNYNSYFAKKEEYGQSIDKIIKKHVNINYRRRLNNLKNILF